MKKVVGVGILLAAVISVASPASSAWVEIDRTYKDEVTYVDSSRIRINGTKAYYWAMATYARPRQFPGLSTSASSEVTQVIVDCERQVGATAFFAWYAGPNATGATVTTLAIPENELKFYPLVPNSLADKGAQIACAAPSHHQ